MKTLITTVALLVTVSSFPLSQDLRASSGLKISKRSGTGFFSSHLLNSGEAPRRLDFLERPACAKGLTFDKCGVGSVCQGDRICAGLQRKVWGEPCEPTQTCGCLPQELKHCEDSSQCEQGEVCALTFLLKAPICVSKHVEKSERWVEELEDAATRRDDSIGASVEPAEPSIEAELGMPLAECSSDSDCSSDLDLKCFYFPSSLTPSPEPCNARDECRCTTSDSFIFPCLSTPDCSILAPGQICAEIPRPLGLPQLGGCVSPNAPSIFGVTEIADFNSTGLTMEPCADFSNCQGDRHCIYYGPQRKDFVCDPSSQFAMPCICIPENDFFCNNDSDCEEEEVCARTPISQRTVCVSKRVMKRYHIVKHVDKVEAEADECPSPTTEAFSEETSESEPQPATSQEPEDAVCIDARMLQHMERKDLVFEKDVWAEVLCDTNGNCATAGHMVIYSGRAFMMKTYCAIVGCYGTTMYVNSPRRRRKLRVKSKSKDMEYTAFAARYSTRAEEKVLSLAIRAGF